MPGPLPAAATAPATAPATAGGFAAPRRFGRVNWRGLWTLYQRAFLRYLKFAVEGIVGPMISAALFLAVFVLALPQGRSSLGGVEPLVFLVPGIGAYQGFHAAFENAAFPIVYDKLEGMMSDVLMAPLRPWEVVIAYVGAAALAGMTTGAVILGLISLIVPLPLADLGTVLVFAALGSLLFALVGFLTGLWAEKWDRYALVETFLVMPLGILSGTFFTLDAVPAAGREAMLLNPVFYGIDGLRAGFIGSAQASPGTGAALLAGLCLVLFLVAWRLFASGYKVRA
ncbi:ABC-2 type transport system permease protein [Tistlia consotensis]|uniref:Transport permease protein n=1 Tax=Tistlia consotensis USBA 355 TaxID=560819 RepID=A0A1Y6BE61_9PROT|nr:ABC transporter permease [Tistlia consotensis]SMF06883.1 ABC-2 type transport system permease protein [Tistlia consotensis USBA 355]SNR36241.1 ABC-2 type transport system permease protein [Tistlia consotensis]